MYREIGWKIWRRRLRHHPSLYGFTALTMTLDGTLESLTRLIHAVGNHQVGKGFELLQDAWFRALIVILVHPVFSYVENS